MAPTTAVAKAAVPRNVVGLLINLISSIEIAGILVLENFKNEAYNSLTVNELGCLKEAFLEAIDRFLKIAIFLSSKTNVHYVIAAKFVRCTWP